MHQSQEEQAQGQENDVGEYDKKNNKVFKNKDVKKPISQEKKVKKPTLLVIVSSTLTPQAIYLYMIVMMKIIR
jgi:hypothetical protein